MERLGQTGPCRGKEAVHADSGDIGRENERLWRQIKVGVMRATRCHHRDFAARWIDDEGLSSVERDNKCGVATFCFIQTKDGSTKGACSDRVMASASGVMQADLHVP